VKLIILQEDKIILIVPVYSIHYSCYASYCIVLEMEEINYLYLYLYLYAHAPHNGLDLTVSLFDEKMLCKLGPRKNRINNSDKEIKFIFWENKYQNKILLQPK
jgi:hypothetical protein